MMGKAITPTPENSRLSPAKEDVMESRMIELAMRSNQGDNMAGFLHDVSNGIECLRESLADAIALAECGLVPNQDRLKQWRRVLNKSFNDEA